MEIAAALRIPARLLGAVARFFALLGALQAFNTSFSVPQSRNLRRDARFHRPHRRRIPPAARSAAAAAAEHPQALRRPEQQRAGRALAHAHGAGSRAHRAHARGVHVSVQLSADEPLHRSLVFAQHLGVARRLHSRGAGTGRNTWRAMRACEAESIAAIGRARSDQLDPERRVSARIASPLPAGFVIVYGNRPAHARQLSGAAARPVPSVPGCPGSDEGEQERVDSAAGIAL